MGVDSGDELREEKMRVLTLPALFLLGVGFLGPLIGLMVLGASKPGDPILKNEYLLYVIQFTVWQAFLSATLSLVVGFLGAFFVEELKIRGGKILWQFCLLCSALPPLIVALGILGSWGRIIMPFGWLGILMGHVFLNFPIPMRLIGIALRERDRQSEIMALSLGASRLQVFFKVTFPSIRASCISSWILAFIYSSTSLFIIMFLGGGPRFTTLEVALYEAVKWNLDVGKAIQIALLQAGLGGFLFYFYLFFQKRRKVEGQTSGVDSVFSFRKKRYKYLIELLWWSSFLMFFGAPLLSLCFDGLAGIEKVELASLWNDFATSLLTAFAVGMVSLLSLYPILHYYYQVRSDQERSFVIWLISCPQFFSPLVIALALTLFFPYLRGSSSASLVGVVLAQTIFVYPLIHLPLREGFLRLSYEKVAIAQSLGASRYKRFLLVELPSMRRPIIFSFLLAVSFSLGEVVTFLIFSPRGVKTLSLNIFQSMSRYRFQEAHLSTLLLMITIFLVLGIAGYLENKNE